MLEKERVGYRGKGDGVLASRTGDGRLAVLGLVLALLQVVKVMAQSSDATCLQLFKASVGDPQGRLDSWNGSKVCKFEGVTCLGFDTPPVYTLELGSFQLTGTFPAGLSSCTSLTHLDLSDNEFTGPIPDDLCASVQNLVILNLSYNQITGHIPANLSSCTYLNNLTLNNNELTGEIPGQLGQLDRLKQLDVSNNRLEGMIPASLVNHKMESQTGFPASSFLNNAGLCGPPLSNNCTATHKGGTSPGVIVGAAVGGAIVLVAIGALFAWFFLGRLRRADAVMMRDKSKWAKRIKGPKSITVAMFAKPLVKIRLTDLMAATDDFSKDNIIGTGRTGTVYKATFPDGSVMAIKRLQDSPHTNRQFRAEMESLGQLKHRNLVSLLGYCQAGSERLLVYKYMPSGSVRDHLHDLPEKEMLGWPIRVKIAIGGARGLAWLHHSCNPRIIHRNISASCILLDDEFEPKITDFGLARLMNPVDTHISTFVNGGFGDVGYVAPEYVRTLVATTKGDVYSFGVVLLELTTSQKPVEVLVDGDFKGNLAEWVGMLSADGRIADAVDQSLAGKGVDEEIMQILRVGSSCVLPNAKERPTMYEVYQLLRAIGQKYSYTDPFDDLPTVSDSVSMGDELIVSAK